MAKQHRASDTKRQAGLRLKAARLVLGIERQDVMAAQLGASVSAYNNWETGARLADVDAMVRLLQLTSIGPDWIYAGEIRSLPYEMATDLRAIAAKVGAEIAGPRSEPPIVSHRARQENSRPPAAAPPKRPRTLHGSQPPRLRHG